MLLPCRNHFRFWLIMTLIMSLCAASLPMNMKTSCHQNIHFHARPYVQIFDRNIFEHAMIPVGRLYILNSLCDISVIQDESEILMLIWNSITMTSKNVTAFQITGVSLVCLTVSSGADLIKHQSSASLAFVRGIQRWPVDSPICGLNAEDFLVCILCQVYT